MPLSKKHRCIFVHIPKTGGQSIELALGMTGGGSKRLFGMFGQYELAHLPAYLIRQFLPDEFRSYFKFSVVRNPYDRLVSEFANRRTNKAKFRYYSRQPRTFRDYVSGIPDILSQDLPHWVSCHLRPQHEFVLEDGKLLVDQLLRFEDYVSGARAVLGRFGITDVPHVNHSRRRPTETYYDAATRVIVQQVYCEDFKAFGYDL